MCSINGFTWEDADLIERMNQVTRHRGEDGEGVYCAEEVSLGHNRLSIIDIDHRSDQPMMSGDKKYTISFNGEIYNYQELKAELEDVYTFVTESDTEVILATYTQWGVEAFARLSGIFSFALWDEKKEELMLVRDKVGVKPLYYSHLDGKLIFSSEIKAILESSDVSRALDIEAFNHYMRLLYTPEPYTMFRDVKKLPAGTYGVFKGGAFKICSYKEDENDRKDITKASFADAARRTRDVVNGAVEKQLVSDKPLGVYLSGGMDSSIIVDRVSSLRSSVDTFSVGFDIDASEDREKFNADFEVAKQTAKHYGTNHHEVLISTEDVVENFEKVIWHQDEPVSNPTALSMYVLAHFAKQKVDVVLGGDGGDELFGGYPRYQLGRKLEQYQKYVPEPLRDVLAKAHPALDKMNTPAGADRMALFMFQKDVVEEVVEGGYVHPGITLAHFQDRYFQGVANTDFVEQYMKVDRESWLRDFSLMLTDKMTMSAALEARVPLLDEDVIAFADTIPLHYKTTLFDTKRVLREAFRDTLPDFLFTQPKRGWMSPGAKWLRRDEVKDMAAEILSPGYYAGTEKLFKWNAIEKMLEDHLRVERYNLTMLWALISFQVWAREYKVTIE